MLRTGVLLALLAVDLAAMAFVGGRQAEEVMLPVRIGNGMLAVARDEVSVAQWQVCVNSGACEALAKTAGKPGNLPVTGVNWFDVQAYVAWANAGGRRHLRLPSATEWRSIIGKVDKAKHRPLFDDPRMAWAASYGQEEAPGGPVRPQGAWSTSRDGIRDLEGNVWEWTSSCSGVEQDITKCAAMHVMGAHDAFMSVFVRDPAAGGCATGKPPTHIGFRLVEDIP